MKRLLSLFLIFFVLCGCSKNGNSFVLNRESLNTAFHAKADGTEFEGYIAFDDKLNMIVNMTAPEEIRGLSLTFCSDRVISTFDNVDDSFLSDDFSDEFAFLSIYKALKSAAQNGVFIKNTDSSYEFIDNGVSLIADNDGNLTSASVKNGFFVFGL